MKILRTSRRNNYYIDLGKKSVKGLKKSQVKFKDENLKKVNEWISGPEKYKSSRVDNSVTSTYKRIGRAESTKMSDEEFSKTIGKMFRR